MFGYAYVKLSDVASYSRDRKSHAAVNKYTYVSVENLLPNKGGKRESDCVPTEGTVVGFNIGDVLIGNIRPYLRKIWLSNCDGGTNGDVLTIRISNNEIVKPEFLYYILASDEFFDYDNNYAKGAKMPRGDKNAVMNYQFFIPSIEEQERIVSILDRFDTLCTDITSGLPAEIEARQKQYEYYRDQLLTFAEKES